MQKKMQGQEQRQKLRRYSVASPCGLRSGLRQSGRPLRGWLERRAEARLYLRGNGKSNLRGLGMVHILPILTPLNKVNGDPDSHCARWMGAPGHLRWLVLYLQNRDFNATYRRCTNLCGRGGGRRCRRPRRGRRRGWSPTRRPPAREPGGGRAGGGRGGGG